MRLTGLHKVALRLLAVAVCSIGLLVPEALVAQREPLLWTILRTPSDDGYVVAAPSEASVLVTATEDIWYLVDIPHMGLYRSIDGGLTWDDDILEHLMQTVPAPDLPVWDIAVAPDDPDVVAVVTDERQEVYVSDDGGDTWTPTGLYNSGSWDPTLLVSDIAISEEYDGQRDIAVSTRLPDGAAAGDIWVVETFALSVWSPQGLDMDVSKVGFSPDYSTDETILGIVSDTDDTFLATGYRDTNTNSTIWNVTDPDFVEIALLDEDSPAEDQLVYCDMSIPADYSGDVPARRGVYVCFTSTEVYDDAYHVEDNEVRRLHVDRGSETHLYSIAYRAGTVMVGKVEADFETGRASVLITSEPDDNYPSWYEPGKLPSGGFVSGVGNALVMFSPDGKWAVCATSTNSVTTPLDWADTVIPGAWSGNAAGSPDESAISRAGSGFLFHYWNQISYIDTDVDQLTDYALFIVGETDPDNPGNLIFLSSVGVGCDSIWRTRAAVEEDLGLYWERVDFLPSETDDIIMRRTPEDTFDDGVYYAVRGSDVAYASMDEGRSWDKIRETPEITDLAVVSNDRLYVLTDDELSIAAWTRIRQWDVWDWAYEIDTGLDSGYSLTFHGDDYIFVGDDGDEGRVSYSSDGGETFQLLPAFEDFVGSTVVEVDEDFDRNKIIYGATDNTTSGISRWIVGGSVDWTALNPPELGYTGLAQAEDVLYGAHDGLGAVRTLVSRAANVTTIDWDTLTVGLTPGTTFRPMTLRTSTNDQVNLWGLDDRAYDFDGEEGCLWVFGDTFALPTPWPLAPATGEVLPCNVCACDSELFCFRWRQLPKAELYELWVAMDADFKYVLLKVDGIDPLCCDSPGLCTFEIPYCFDCGETYYWRVRATSTDEGEAVHSRWSPSMRFVVAEGSTVEGMHIAPAVKWPEPGGMGVPRVPGFSWTGFPHTTKYEFLLAEDNTFAAPIAREELSQTAYVYPGELNWGETYFWRVRSLEPHPSEWLTSSFTVMTEPVPAQEIGPSPLEDLPSAMPRQEAPVWVWLVIGSLGLLVSLVIVAAAMKRRSA
jgi:hypothetical protein